MYFQDDFLHFRLNELVGLSTLVSLFDVDLAKRFDNIYSYHRWTLKESDNQPLMIHITECVDFRHKLHTQKITQPEFIFSDDMDIF